MQTTPDAISALYINFLATFSKAFGEQPVWWQKLASEIPSSTRENRYAWMKELSGMKEWIGERQVDNLAARSYSLVNKDYEKTIGLDRNDVEDDNFGLFSQALQQLAYQGRKLQDDLIALLIQAGNTALAWDGQYFFDTDHPVDFDDSSKGTWSNNNTTTALNATNYAAVRAAMMSIIGEDGRVMSVSPNVLVVPPQLEVQGRQIVQADTIAAASGINAAQNQTNVLKGTADVLVIPQLANQATTWYMLDTTKPVKPFFFQNRKAVTFTALASPNDANVFLRKKFLYGIDGRGAAGYALPFLAARCIA